jgi:hypothetical protein
MKTLVIYDSVFGNTEKIAQSIAAALGTQAVPVSQVDAGQLRGLDLLVVGSPTRKFSPTEDISKLLKDLSKESPDRCMRSCLRYAHRTWKPSIPKSFDLSWTRAVTPLGQLPNRSKKRAVGWPRRVKASTLLANRGRSKTANLNAPRIGQAG